MTLLDLIEIYDDCFLHHLPAAIVAHSLRIAPGLDEEDVRRMTLETVAKELTAAVNLFDHAPIDYTSILSDNPLDRAIPFCNRFPASEEVATDTYIKMCGLRTKLSNSTLFPRGGSKTVGRKVAENFWISYTASGQTFKHDGSMKSAETQVTVDDCLRLYQETGGYPAGPVEVRASWKYSQITPRIYYARGGDVQVAAQYMQGVANTIIDEFPEVHRLDRFSPPSDPLDDDDVEIIYDYASFTSSLDAIKGFVDYLSVFFTGTKVLVVDPWIGLIAMDLGYLFAEYNRVCNHYQDFDISRLSLTEAHESIFQHTCGMLGVEGNIILATLLHGLFLRFIAGLRRSKAVGDDAKFHHRTSDGKLSSWDREYAHWMLAGLGKLQPEKMFAFESDPAVEQVYRYVKRPLFRDGNIMISGLLIPLPSQIPLTGALDGYHTVTPSDTNPCRIVFKQIIRFLDVLEIYSISIDSEPGSETYPVVIHLAYLRRLLREKDETGRFSELGRSNHRTHYHLPPVDLWGKVKYVDWAMREEIGYFDAIRFPQYGGADEAGSCDGRAGSIMVREQSRGRSFLVRMGYMFASMCYEEHSMSSVGEDFFRELLEGNYTPVMEYTIERDIPIWYALIRNTL